MTDATLRVGMVGFTNAEPFRLVPPPFAVEWVSGDPSFLSKRMSQGALDVCLLPIGALQYIGDAVTPLGPYGIACRGHVLSLRLFSHIPLSHLAHEERTLFITPRTTTTRLLVGELFTMQFGKRPTITEDFAHADARMLIGDEAMDLTREEFRWPVAKDISEWWFEQTGLGFVFAQWMVGKHVSPETIATLTQWIEANLQYSITPDGKQALRTAGARAGWSADITDLYFERLDFRLEEAHLQGMSAFRTRLKGGHHAN